jgi:hypothetical protein
MTFNTSPRPVSPLRARMIEDMTVRGFKEDTRRDYVRHVRAFAAFRPVARYGDGGRPASFPTASDAERHAAAEQSSNPLCSSKESAANSVQVQASASEGSSGRRCKACSPISGLTGSTSWSSTRSTG